MEKGVGDHGRRPLKVIISAFMSVIVLILSTSVAFAADPIEIEYSGGSRIDDVARVSEYEVSHLYRINRTGLTNTSYFGGPWKETELQNQGVPGKGVEVPKGTKIWEDTGFICDSDIEINGELYDLKVTLKKTVNNTANKAWFWKRYAGTNVDVWPIDTPSAANNMAEGVFCSCEVEILKHGTMERLKPEDLWMCVSDLDCTQSFGSSDIDLSPSNLLIKKKGQFSVGTASGSQSGTGDAYVNGTGLYSLPYINVPNASAGDGADVFMKVLDSGIYNMVFGFKSAAGSPIHFFTTKNTVEYRSVNGTVTGIKSEVIIKGGRPSGSSQEPDDGHSFVKWTADGDIKLKTGETVPAGDPLTEDQIKNAVIVKDTVFTAYNEPVHRIETEVVNGKITPSEEGIPDGQNRRIIYEPDPGYQLKTLIVDDEEKNIAEYPASVAFENIKGDHKVKAVFEKIPRLEIEKTADKKVYNAGDTATYNVVVRQTAEGAEARDVVIKDVLPDGLTLNENSISGDVRVVSTEPGSYEIAIESLTGEVTYTYTAVTDGEKEAEELINVVTAQAGNVPGDPAKATETIGSLLPKPEISKMVSNETPLVGDEIEYSISVKEPQEGIVLKNAVVTDKLPEGIDFVKGSLTLSGDEGEVSIEDGVITAKIEELSGEAVITFKAIVTSTEGRIVNIALLTGEKIEPLEAEATITVKEEAEPDPATPKTTEVPDPTAGPGNGNSARVQAAEQKSVPAGESGSSSEDAGVRQAPKTGDGSKLVYPVAAFMAALLAMLITAGRRIFRAQRRRL